MSEKFLGSSSKKKKRKFRRRNKQRKTEGNLRRVKESNGGGGSERKIFSDVKTKKFEIEEFEKNENHSRKTKSYVPNKEILKLDSIISQKLNKDVSGRKRRSGRKRLSDFVAFDQDEDDEEMDLDTQSLILKLEKLSGNLLNIKNEN